VKINRIDITHHRLLLDPPLLAAWDPRPRSHFDVSIVRVGTDEGLVGVGSGGTMPGFAGHEDLLLGEDPLEGERHFRIIENLSFHYGRCWPLDVALWDLVGQIRGEPCWKLLGGLGRRVRAYASSATRRDPGEMADVALRVVESGFLALKLRFHRADWHQDVAAVEAVRKTVGDRLTLMVDCNQAWRMPWDVSDPWSLAQALTVAGRLEELDVYWMEEPLHRGDYEGLAALRQATRIQVAGGKMARELHELRELITRGCLDIVQPDAVLTGGLTGLSRVARTAHDHGVVFTPHTWGNGIGLLANAHLAAGLAGSPFLEFPFDPPEWTPAIRDFALAEAIVPDSEGWIELSDRPGLGIELAEDRLAATRL
jgi:L-alanine-DL-glutamate epimerase-like enolase superfamily enzyme